VLSYLFSFLQYLFFFFFLATGAANVHLHALQAVFKFEPSGHPAGSLNDHERATATGRVARAPIKQIRIAESIRVA